MIAFALSKNAITFTTFTCGPARNDWSNGQEEERNYQLVQTLHWHRYTDTDSILVPEH